ncbi:hypothetical protein OG763_43070 [Streptomyces sp. NBC_01230]|uniref:hypothetical protein n=1 Tax=unclassified Streptomyces TaxID=2593676 RepID=UPI002E0EA8FC|nr:hypothetical protein OG763_00120 [Streptomyces sp. NBC_01230]WSQ32050.1 hypothetical protein OG763_43070 [Streptomyces sp. NBC_01230]
MNNASSHFRKRKLNADGIEMHIAIDYLAAFTPTKLPLCPLRADTPSRVVNVESMALEDTRMVRFGGEPRPPRIDPARDDLRSLNAAPGWKPLDAYARARTLPRFRFGRGRRGSPSPCSAFERRLALRLSRAFQSGS